VTYSSAPPSPFARPVLLEAQIRAEDDPVIRAIHYESHTDYTMDHWGDPWADDADTSTHTKEEVASPQPPSKPTFAHAPIVLNGFLDDAQWGSNEDEDAPRWATSSSKSIIPTTNISPGRSQPASAWNENTTLDGKGLEQEEGKSKLVKGDEWSTVEEVQDDNVISETSDSTTTIQPDEEPSQTSNDLPELPHAEDDLSTRASTSPSDISHVELTAESPRTSIEEERAAAKIAESTAVFEAGSASDSGQRSDNTQLADDDFGDFEEDTTEEVAGLQQPASPDHAQPLPVGVGTRESATVDVREPSVQLSTHASAIGTDGFSPNAELLAQLFPPVNRSPKSDEPADDPISSTSGRKAWYRLTRKQTMREFNSGTLDDNYIRITWKASHIRSEVSRTVARWANEDRMAGRGPGARASFFWDTPALPAQKAHSHARKTSHAPVSNPKAIEPLPADVPPSFNWSSPASIASTEPNILSARSISSVTAKHNTITKLQRQDCRSVSLDLTRHPKEPNAHKRTATASNFLGGGSSPVTSSSTISASSFQSSTAEKSNPWSALGTLDTSVNSQPEPATIRDEDDDWGEMVESPAVSTVQTPVADLSEASMRKNTLSTPSTTPISMRSSPFSPLPTFAGPRHASSIVRLKGTVSPTSALFKPYPLVPTSTGEGPIGPGLLKSINRSGERTSEKAKSTPTSVSMGNKGPSPETDREERGKSTNNSRLPTKQPASVAEQDLHFHFKSVAPHIESSSPSQPSASYSWGKDANFSIVESSTPSVSLPPPPASLSQVYPSGTWSISDSPAPPTPAESPVFFARPPPRSHTPPTQQPLTGTTTLAQRRKAEEDDAIRSILEGLPDLSYMLRR